jgi:AcrR family transcriptional regulator
MKRKGAATAPSEGQAFRVTKRVRLPAQARRSQLIEAAARLILEQGYLPLALDRLAADVRVSKASIYGYFPSQHDLCNAVVERSFEALRQAGLEAAAAGPDLTGAALACAEIYYAEVAREGAVAHIVLRDLYMAGRLRPELARFRDRTIGALARLARRELKLPARETIGAVNMVIAIPEEAGRLAFQGDLTLERGRDLCQRLVRSSLDSLRPG